MHVDVEEVVEESKLRALLEVLKLDSCSSPTTQQLEDDLDDGDTPKRKAALLRSWLARSSKTNADQNRDAQEQDAMQLEDEDDVVVASTFLDTQARLSLLAAVFANTQRRSTGTPRHHGAPCPALWYPVELLNGHAEHLRACESPMRDPFVMPMSDDHVEMMTVTPMQTKKRTLDPVEEEVHAEEAEDKKELEKEKTSVRVKRARYSEVCPARG
ncbi:hypothetical protein EXIGLDRAFT_771191 [Exidia glandulosa HHB12029]|uniref:Uncharacterized protein n=1 Tax=Exidia glandulosa HHB12029 TaxID=1314781 RepID=A0A165G6Y1_EXIGL|nr:hypothetical protein EXIGLDRAFT_771191 [Exidia glandulosa HHB12029]